MVKIKETPHLLPDGSVDLEIWLKHLTEKKHFANIQLIRNACVLSQLAGADKPTESGESCLQQGLAMAEILADLDFDQTTLAAAIVYESVQYADLSIEDVREHLGDPVARLVEGAARMDAISLLRKKNTDRQMASSQSDNLRKMLIAMVDNIQVVLIKLAERIRVLRKAGDLPETRQQIIAQETMDIYAPLANRLGIGQIKWELEDLAFRYLDSVQYKRIAKALKSRRIERDQLVTTIVYDLKNALQKAGLQEPRIYGRSKHIYSIFRKMQRKNVDVEKIYDATAVRVLVDTIEDCYTVLSIVHHLWKPIPEEFDDYIVHPKSNGYRSLHTAVVNPNDKIFEVQIRTKKMHDEAELGVAAHWVYKEGGLQPNEGHERKIAWLRQVLDWQKEITETHPTDVPVNVFDDRIYVFTPAGDVVDLPPHATPLDFAYHIHSQVGHRCRGAKVDGNIVPLTYKLKTGEQISILTTKHPKPSRDWLNPQLGYLHSAKAKAKVMQWYKQQDYEKHRQEGMILLEKEFKKQEIPLHQVNHEKLSSHLHFKNTADFFAAIGRGEIKLSYIIQNYQSISPISITTVAIEKESAKDEIPIHFPTAIKKKSQPFSVSGIDNLLSRAAQCCKPIPGDLVIGYITQGQGISVHRKDCVNILKLEKEKQSRLIEVAWGDTTQENFPVDIAIAAHDRPGLIRDVTQIMSAEKINLLAATTRTVPTEQRAYMTFTLQIGHLTNLKKLLNQIQQIPDVVSVERTK